MAADAPAGHDCALLPGDRVLNSATGATGIFTGTDGPEVSVTTPDGGSVRWRHEDTEWAEGNFDRPDVPEMPGPPALRTAAMDRRTLRARIRADRARWAQARTLADVGELTALWLEGEIVHQPGYGDPRPGEEIGPDPETRDLVPVLAACNRAGFATNGSQPGEVIAGDGDGWPYEQRSAVEGFCDAVTLGRLRDAVAWSGLLVVEHDPAALPRRRYSAERAVPVSRAAGQEVTGFGVQLSRRDLCHGHVGYGECHRDAVEAICGAWQVTIIDPEWGRNDVLWPALAKFARQ